MRHTINKIVFAASILFFAAACDDSEYEFENLFPEWYHKIASIQDAPDGEVKLYDFDAPSNMAFSVLRTGSDPSLAASVGLESMTQEELATYNSKYVLVDPSHYTVVSTLSFNAGETYKDVSALFSEESVRELKTKAAALEKGKSYCVAFKLSDIGDCSVYADKSYILRRIVITEPKLETTGDSEFVECDLSSTDKLEFAVSVDCDNKWDTETSYASGDDVLTAYNAVHGTSYLPLPAEAYTFTAGVLQAGSNRAVSTIAIDKSKLTASQFYTLAVKITGNSMFTVGEKNTVLYHISVLPIADGRSSWKLVSCSSAQAGSGPEKMLDDNTSTKYESRYSDSTGSVGDKNTLPVNIVWDMGGNYRWRGFQLGRRRDNSKYYADLRAGYVELSDDGETWIKAEEFDFGDKSNTVEFWNVSYERWPEFTGRYIRLTITQSNRNTAVSVTEFKPYLAKISD